MGHPGRPKGSRDKQPRKPRKYKPLEHQRTVGTNWELPPESEIRTGLPGRPGIVRTPARKARDLRQLLEDDIGLQVLEDALILHCAQEPEPEPPKEGEDPPLPSKFRALLNRMQDPVFSTHTIIRKMQACGVTWVELVRIVSAGFVAQSLFRSQQRMDEVLESIGDAAVDKEVPCTHCHTEGKVIDHDALERSNDPDLGEEPIDILKDCPDCGGSGYLMSAGDIEAQKLYLQTHGMLGGKSGGGMPNPLSPSTIINLGVQQGVVVKKDDGKKEEPVISRVQRIIETG